MIFSNEVYDALVYVAQIVLPALAALYAALSGIWGLPYGTEVTGTITALDAFLGALLKISSIKYNKLNADDGE